MFLYQYLFGRMSNGRELHNYFQKVQAGFAYEMMALEIELDQSSQLNHSKIQSISRLLQLYMIGVQVLQSKSDPRYKYFSNKIQTLVKKRFILEEMNRKSAKHIEPHLLIEAKKVEMDEKKEDYDLQIYLNKEHLNSKKIRQFVDIAETKIKHFQTRVQGTVLNQDKQLQERIKRRKMRSEAGSVQKFKMIKGQIIQKNIAGMKMNAFFEPMQIKLPIRRQPNSDDKQGNAKKQVQQHRNNFML